MYVNPLQVIAHTKRGKEKKKDPQKPIDTKIIVKRTNSETSFCPKLIYVDKC